MFAGRAFGTRFPLKVGTQPFLDSGNHRRGMSRIQDCTTVDLETHFVDHFNQFRSRMEKVMTEKILILFYWCVLYPLEKETTSLTMPPIRNNNNRNKCFSLPILSEHIVRRLAPSYLLLQQQTKRDVYLRKENVDPFIS